jgi:hypothetical protein
MARGSELLDTITAQIISLKDAGLSYPEITRQLYIYIETIHYIH